MQRILLFTGISIGSLMPVMAPAQGIEAVADKVPVVVRQPSKTITPDTYTGRQLVVGSGGGFTGFSTAFYLLDNGQLFGRRSPDTTFTFIGQQTAANTKRAFRTAECRCRIKKTEFNNPGNTYRFVRWRRGNEIHKVTWGGTGVNVPAKYPKFYDAFMAMIPASSRPK